MHLDLQIMELALDLLETQIRYNCWLMVPNIIWAKNKPKDYENLFLCYLSWHLNAIMKI